MWHSEINQCARSHVLTGCMLRDTQHVEVQPEQRYAIGRRDERCPSSKLPRGRMNVRENIRSAFSQAHSARFSAGNNIRCNT